MKSAIKLFSKYKYITNDKINQFVADNLIP